MRIIGSVKEDLSIEKRISIVPEIVKKYTDLKLSVLLEKNYGEHLGISDVEYENKGANFCNSAKEVLEKSEMILKVNFPLNDEINHIKSESIIIGQFDTTKYYRPKPTPNVINGIHSAAYPPWDQQDRKKRKKKMYHTTQNDHVGYKAYNVDPYNIRPSAIIPKRRPLSIPSKLELKAHTLTLRKI